MSRSNNTEIRNPAERFFRWDGENGGFRYYQKAQDGKGENIKVDLPFRFMVLDVLSTITGYDDSTSSGYWSNEVRDLRIEPFTVRTQKGQCAKGLYHDVINELTGAKYAQSVYIAFNDNETYKMGNIKMVGAALGAWIEFRKKNKIFSGMMCIDSMIDGQKGRTQYKIPVFTKLEEVDNALETIAIDLDKRLQEYLTQYLNQKKVETVEAQAVATAIVSEPEAHSNDPMNDGDNSLPF